MTKAAGLRGTSLRGKPRKKIISNATKSIKGEVSAARIEAVVEESPVEAAWKQAVGH